MDSQDLRSVMSTSELPPPEEAAQNINRSNIHEINPDQYHELKSELEPKIIANERIPASVEPVTQDFTKQSKQHLALTQNDIPVLSDTESRMKYHYNKFVEIPSKTRERNELVRKQMYSMDGNLSEEEEEKLQDLNASISELSKGAPEDMGDFEKWVSDVGAAGVDIARSYYENKGLAATIIGGGAAVAGGFGAVIGGPFGALVGAKIGTASGIATAAGVVPMVDAFKETSSSVYNDLKYGTKEDGSPLNLTHERRFAVSQGVGLVSGVAAHFAGKVLANNNPFLKKFLDPNAAAKYVVGKPELMAKLDIIGGIMKSGMGEGFEEFIQQYAETIGTELGKVDESEESFMNALDNITSLDVFKNAAYSATVGFGAGAGTATVLNVPGYSMVKGEYQKAQAISQQKREVLETQNMLMDANAALSSTKMQELAPEQAKQFKKNLFEKLGFEPNAWFSVDDLMKFANSPEKGAKIKSLFDMNPEMVNLAKETNSHVQLSKAEVLDIMTEFPDIADHMRLSPDGQSAVEIRNEAKVFADNLTKADLMRNQLMETLGVVEDQDKVKSVMNEALGDLKDSPYFESRDQYAEYEPLKNMKTQEQIDLESQSESLSAQKKDIKAKIKQGTETGMDVDGIKQLEKDLSKIEDDHKTVKESLKQYKKIISDKDVDGLNKAHLDARMQIDKILVGEVNRRFDTYEDAEYDQRTKEEIAQETAKLEKENSIVKAFQEPELHPETKKGLMEHKKKGFSSFAIDPKSLSEAQRIMFYDENGLTPSIKENLKKRKAFVEGGIHVEEAAMLSGLESGDELLKILSETPTRKQVEERIKRDPIREEVEREKIRQEQEDSRLKAIDESFSKVTNLHLKEMQQMVSRSWNTTKRGIIKIASKVPTLQELNGKAQDAVKNMKIRDLNPVQFKQGESKSQKNAIKQFVDGKIEQAFGSKYKAALNSELMKETIKARDKVAKFQKFWKKMKDPSNIQALKDAGYLDSLNDYMTAYKLDGAIQGETEQKAFNAFIKKQVSLGNLTPKIPDRLNNTQASFKDLTVEQYQEITKMGMYLLHQAKKKNAYMEQNKLRAEHETLERTAEQIDTLAKDHPDYDETRAKRDEKSSEESDILNNIRNNFNSLVSSVKNTKHIIAKLDNYKTDGFFYKTFVDPFVRSQTAKRQENFDLKDYKTKVVNESYGDNKKFVAAMEEQIEIPEFANIDSLNNGQLTRAKLFRLFAAAGDESGRERIKNFVDANGAELDFDTVLKVFDREISEKEAVFIQNYFVNSFKRYTNPYFEMHKRTTGIEPEMVRGASFLHKGKVIEGGYQPLDYQRTPDEVKAQQQLDKMQENDLLNDENAFFARRRAAEMTKQGRSKERTGSKRPLELSMRNHFDALEEIIHDIHFRETGIDMLKILKNDENVKNIKSVVGSKDYNVLLDGIKDVISKVSDKDTSVVHREQNRIINASVAGVKSLHAFKTISFNVISAAVQFDSLIYMPLRTGPKTMLHLSKTIAKMATGAFTYNKMVEDAQAILDDIKYEQDGIDDTVIKSLNDTIPEGSPFFKEYKKLGKGVARLMKLRTKTMDISFAMLRHVDKMNKVVATHTLTSQFLAGDIEGYDSDTIAKMSDAEKVTTLKRVVKQNVDLVLTASSTLDKTAVEKHAYGKIFANYWTDGRSRLNTLMSQGDRLGKNIKKGDYRSAATQAMLFALVTGASGAYVNAIRGKDEERLEELKKIKDPSDAAAFALEGMYDIFMSPMMDSIPVLNSVKYSIESSLDYGGKQIRPVSVPTIAVLTDIVAGALAIRKKFKGKNIKKGDRKALITLGGYAVGGAPTNVINKLIDISSRKSNQRKAKDFMNDIIHLNGLIKEYKEEYKDEPEAQEFIKDMEDYQETLPKFESESSNYIPEDAKESIKKAVSGGDWTKYNEETGAVGIYQFTEERWKALMLRNPDLGLTENGRLAKSPEQQEKAMERENEENARNLVAYELDVTTANLLGAHEFGFDAFAAIASSKDGEKLSDAIGAEDAKRPVFSRFKTVGDVKKYLTEQVRKS